MRYTIAHRVQIAPRNITMLGSKYLVITLDVACGFADDFKVPYYRILNQLILQKHDFGHIGGIGIDTVNRLQNMCQIVGNALQVRLAHTGTASARTVARKLDGKALGVTTSTGMPSN